MDTHIIIGIVMVVVIVVIFAGLACYLLTRPQRRDVLIKRTFVQQLLHPQKRGASGTLYDMRSGEEIDETAGLPQYAPPTYSMVEASSGPSHTP